MKARDRRAQAEQNLAEQRA
jgi:uncharacterized protein YjbI with pentapeptide repeats/GNAT superfamily N-acetyltransferase